MNTPVYRSPVYLPYLQPTSNLGSYNRYAASGPIGSRTKFGNASRMYNYAHATGKTQELLQEFSLAIYGRK
jgi:hypothetical protein